MYSSFFFLIEFYLTSSQYKSYGEVPALLVEKDLECPSVHERSRVEPPTFRKLAGWLPHMKESKVPVGIRTHGGEGQVV
jgi:hypothetical protein